MLNRLFNIPRFIGPLLTVVFTLLYHYGSIMFGYSITAIWINCFLVAGAFLGGLRAGFICATWVSLYAWYAIPNDASRIIQISLGSFAIAGIVGWQTKRLRDIYRAADLMFNGNQEKLTEGLKFFREAKQQLSEVRKLIELGEDRLGNVLSGVVGYRQLRQSIDEVNAWYENEENVRRAQEIENDAPDNADWEAQNKIARSD